MACWIPGDSNFTYGKIDVSLSSAGIDRITNSNERHMEEHDDEESIGSEDGDVKRFDDDICTFLVVVNDDGSFTIHNSTFITETGAESDGVIPVTLPVKLLKSVEQPLSGARALPNTGGHNKVDSQDLVSSVSPLQINIPGTNGVLVDGTISLEAVTGNANPWPKVTASVMIRNPALNSGVPGSYSKLEPSSVATAATAAPSVSPIVTDIKAKIRGKALTFPTPTRDRSRRVPSAAVGDEKDDPTKLWCVCRKPHNNRFMICCDHCEEWFHGRCVRISKAQGEAIPFWYCHTCQSVDTLKH